MFLLALWGSAVALMISGFWLKQKIVFWISAIFWFGAAFYCYGEAAATAKIAGGTPDLMWGLFFCCMFVGFATVFIPLVIKEKPEPSDYDLAVSELDESEREIYDLNEDSKKQKKKDDILFGPRRRGRRK